MRIIYRESNLWFQLLLTALTTGFFTSGISSLAILLWSGCANAQVISDGTTNTIVNPSGNNFNILNGIDKGNNLFHSFSNFSVPTGAWATFDLTNTPNITTIFSRVTGGNVSNIDGLIRTLNSNNPVSLFLMNPAGIMFGQNASLNIGGSFVGTTANSIKFADGGEFSSAVKPDGQSLLTMSVPIGLQLGKISGKVAIAGPGHNLTTQNSLILPYVSTSLQGNLSVKSSNTLAFLGSTIDLNDGILLAPEGRVELGSVTEGLVGLNTVNQGFYFDYSQVSKFGDINLAGRSLVNVNGINGGSIQVQGGNISLTDGSVLWVQNRGDQKAGDINVFAADSLKLSGATADIKIRTSLINETIGSGRSGDIRVVTPNLSVNNGAVIANRNYKSADSGAINITSSNLNVSGYIPIDPSAYATIGTLTFSPGKAGDVRVKTQNLFVSDGGYLGSTTFGTGASGTIKIDADHVNVIGATPISVPSVISAMTNGNAGNAGNLILNTRTLTLRESGTITTASLGVGNAGDLIVNATESINMSGRAASVSYGSNISSTVVSSHSTSYYSQLINVSKIPRGSSGQVTVNTPILKISDEARINTSNYGIGNAGALNINTQRLDLKNGYLASFTASGQGGNMNIRANSLILRDKSIIIGTALGSGDGGNITINSPVIVGLNNSDIVANAFTGRGGNIQIKTQGIFGLKYRNQLTTENDITASSRFGVNGTVDINNFGVDPSSGLVQLPANVTDSSQQIASSCSANTGSSFVATGRGGIPQNPTQGVRSDRTWSDTRDISAYRKTDNVTAQIPTTPQILVQATSWHRNAQGKIKLVADNSPNQLQPSLTCAAVPEI